MTRTKLAAILGLGVLPLVAVLGCEGGKASPANSAMKPAAETMPATGSSRQSEADVYTASGPVVVENQLDLTAQREGVVASILSDTGSRVKRGDLLATLDDRQLAANLDAARAKTRSTADDLKNWEAEAKVLDADFQRAQKMRDAQIISQEEYDHAKYKAESDQWDVKRVQELLANAQAEQHSLELELEKTRIRAPFEGVVARRYIRVGQSLAKGDRLFWVTATAPLLVKFTLPAEFEGSIRKKQALEVSSPENPQQHSNAKVVQVSPVVDPASGTIDVTVQLEGPSEFLYPGMTANVRLEKPR